MPKTNLMIWKYFLRVPANPKERATEGICKRCNRTVKANIKGYGNLTRHLRVIHNINPTESTSERGASKSKPEIKIERPSSSADMSVEAVQSTPPRRIHRPLQIKITKSITPTTAGPVRSQIDEKWVKATCETFTSFSLIDNPHMQWILRKIPGYCPPTSTAIEETILDRLVEARRSEVMTLLADAENVAVTIDTWTDKSQNNFLGVTAHLLGPKMCPCSAALECVSYIDDETGYNIAAALQAIFDTWNIANKIAAITTESGTSVMEAVTKLDKVHIPSVAHTLNEVVTLALEDPYVKGLRTQISDLSTDFRRAELQEALHSAQEELSLATMNMNMDSPTRWCATYEMIERAFECWVPLTSALSEFPQYAQNFPENELEELQFFCTLMKLFKEVADALSSKIKPLISQVRQPLHEQFRIRFLTSLLITGFRHFNRLAPSRRTGNTRDLRDGLH